MVMKSAAPSLLSALARRMNRRPVSITALLRVSANCRDFKWFQDTVREYLPESAFDILIQPDPPAMLESFEAHFAAEYAPLCGPYLQSLRDLYYDIEYGDEDYLSVWEILRNGIPLEYHGCNLSGEAQLWDREPELCLLILLLDPETPALEALPPGALIPWQESAAVMVNRETVIRAAAARTEPRRLTRALYRAGQADLADAIRWIVADHDNILAEACVDEEAYASVEHPLTPWNSAELAAIQEVWQEARVILDAVSRARKLITHQPQTTLELILDALEQFGDDSDED